jgi:hypothetical protein
MNRLDEVERLAEKLRHEPYHTLTNDCIIKARKLKKACAPLGIPVKVVACIGLARARLFGRWWTLPVIHGWAEVEGKRIEVSRPRGISGRCSRYVSKVRFLQASSP